MYYFLDNLVFCYYSVTHPKMLVNFFSHCKTIAYQGYMAQLFFLHLLGAAKVMAYDCYVEHLPTSALYQAQNERGLLHPGEGRVDGRLPTFHCPGGSDHLTILLRSQRA
ncbi:unnamed protein product [Natator depressus]